MNFKAAMVGAGSTSRVLATAAGQQLLTWVPTSFKHGPSDTSLQITIHKLNRQNYLEWAQSVRLVIDGKGKLGYLNGEVKAPSSTDAKYKKWRSENSMVTAWLINSMEPTIGKPFMFLPTAHGIWEAISKHLRHGNYSQLYELNTLEEWESNKDIARYKKAKEHSRVFVSLAGLNRDLDEVQGRIFGCNPLPTI